METFKERTNEEILAKIESLEYMDPIGAQRMGLAAFLSYVEFAAIFEKIHKKPCPVSSSAFPSIHRNEPSINNHIKHTLAAAWEGANKKNINTVVPMTFNLMALSWMRGDKPHILPDFSWYGKDMLIKFSEFYNFDYTKFDDGQRKNSKDDALKFFAIYNLKTITIKP